MQMTLLLLTKRLDVHNVLRYHDMVIILQEHAKTFGFVADSDDDANLRSSRNRLFRASMYTAQVLPNTTIFRRSCALFVSTSTWMRVSCPLESDTWTECTRRIPRRLRKI